LLAEYTIFVSGDRRVVEPTRIDRDFVPVEKPFRDRAGAARRSTFESFFRRVVRRAIETWPERIADTARKPIRPGG
jgi:hypothetical protein